VCLCITWHYIVCVFVISRGSILSVCLCVCVSVYHVTEYCLCVCGSVSSVCLCVCISGGSEFSVCLCVCISRMGWLRFVSSLKLQVSFAKEPYKRDDILQKRPIILRSLLIVATP